MTLKHYEHVAQDLAQIRSLFGFNDALAFNELPKAVASQLTDLRGERDQLQRQLDQAIMLKEQAQRYHEGVYDLFKRYCPDALRNLPIDASQRTLGATLTQHLGERAEKAEAEVLALRGAGAALPQQQLESEALFMNWHERLTYAAYILSFDGESAQTRLEHLIARVGEVAADIFAALKEVRTSARERLHLHDEQPALSDSLDSAAGGVTHPPDNTSRFCEAHQIAQADETCPCCEAVHQADEVTRLRSRGQALVQQWREQADAIEANAPGIAPMGTYALRLAQITILRACADALSAALRPDAPTPDTAGR